MDEKSYIQKVKLDVCMAASKSLEKERDEWKSRAENAEFKLHKINETLRMYKDSGRDELKVQAK